MKKWAENWLFLYHLNKMAAAINLYVNENTTKKDFPVQIY